MEPLRVDQALVLRSWRELCEQSPELGGRPVIVSDELIYEILRESDVDYAPDEPLPIALVSSAQSFAAEVGTVGTVLHQLRLLTWAISSHSSADDEQARALLRVHHSMKTLMVQVASIALMNLDRELGDLDRIAYRDHLTGLWNRAAFDRDMIAACAQAVRPVTIAYADIDGLKAVNDQFGHPAGDALIRDFGVALSLVMEPLDIHVYRWGGDEHALLSVGHSLPVIAAAIDQVRDLFDKFSVGISSTSEVLVVPDALLKESDREMYLDKNNRKRRALQIRLVTILRALSGPQR